MSDKGTCKVGGGMSNNAVLYEYDIKFLVGSTWVDFDGGILSIVVVKTDDGSDGCEVSLYNPDGYYAPESDTSWRHVIVPNREVRVRAYVDGVRVLSFRGLINSVELNSSDRTIKLALSSMYKLADKTIRYRGMSTIFYTNSLSSINEGIPQGKPGNRVDWYMEDIFVDLARKCGFRDNQIEIEQIDANKSNICFEQVEFSGTYADAFNEIRDITGMEISVSGDGVISMTRSSEGRPNIVNRRVDVSGGGGRIGTERLVLDSVVVLDMGGKYVGRDKYEIYVKDGVHYIRMFNGLSSVYVSFTYVKHVLSARDKVLMDVSLSYTDEPVYTGAVVRGESVKFVEDEKGQITEERDTIEGYKKLENPYVDLIVRIGVMEPKILEINDRRLGTKAQCEALADREVKEGVRRLRKVSLDTTILEDIDVGDVVQIIEDVVGINEAYRVRYVQYEIGTGVSKMSLDVDHYGETLMKE